MVDFHHMNMCRQSSLFAFLAAFIAKTLVLFPLCIMRSLNPFQSGEIKLVKTRFASIIFVLLFSTLLTGCVAWYDVYDRDDSRLNLARPNILPGQKAYVYGNQFIVNAVAETGLFASVERTSSRQPLPSGVYISMEQTDSYAGRDSGILGFMFNFFSLGLIPDPAIRANHQSFHVQFYQNGSKLLDKTSEVRELQEAGWVALFVDENKTWMNEARILVNRMISDLNKAKK